jgi:hypothetical protein
MLSGLSLLHLFPTSLNTRKGKIMLLLILCLVGKGQYEFDADFKDVLLNCKEGRAWNKYVLNEGYLFRANRLCIPVGSVHLLLLQEAHGGGLMGHFGAKKTEDMLATHFFWTKIRRDVERFVSHCTTCQKANHA